MCVPVLLRWIGAPRAWSCLRCARGSEGVGGGGRTCGVGPGCGLRPYPGYGGNRIALWGGGAVAAAQASSHFVAQGRDAAFGLVRATFRMCRSPGKRSAPGVGAHVCHGRTKVMGVVGLPDAASGLIRATRGIAL